MGAWQMHYGLENLPPGAPESWWEYHPAGLAWTPVPRGRIWVLGHICYVPSLRVIGFSGENLPVTLYDPEKRTFEAFGGFRGWSPGGYTLRRRVRQ
jgi:hypothetical protein